MMWQESLIDFADRQDLEVAQGKIAERVEIVHLAAHVKERVLGAVTEWSSFPTIIPAALRPGPLTLLAVLIVPPRVPRSVRV